MDENLPRASEFVARDGRVYHLGLHAGEVADTVLLVGDPARALRVAERFEVIETEVRHREYVTLTGSLDSRRLSVIGTGMGTDNVEIALVELYGLWEFELESGLRQPGLSFPRTLIRVGTSGGTRDDVPPGTQVITSHAIGLDSTALYYDHESHDDVCDRLEESARQALARGTVVDGRFGGHLPCYATRADPGLVTLLEEAAERLSVPFEVGVTVTAPSFYGGSGRHIEGLRCTVPTIKSDLATVEVPVEERARPLRVLNMEMESALLFHLAHTMGYRAATICPILSAPGSHDQLLDPQLAVGDAIDVALDVVCRLPPPDRPAHDPPEAPK